MKFSQNYFFYKHPTVCLRFFKYRYFYSKLQSFFYLKCVLFTLHLQIQKMQNRISLTPPTPTLNDVLIRMIWLWKLSKTLSCRQTALLMSLNDCFKFQFLGRKTFFEEPHVRAQKCCHNLFTKFDKSILKFCYFLTDHRKFKFMWKSLHG